MKRLLWVVLISVFIFASFSPTLYELSQKDTLQGRSFELIHNYVTDYNFYISRIREGVEGRWTVVERYTSESHPGSYIQIFYLLLGKADVFSAHPFLSATAIYHISRIVLGIALLLMSALWARRMFASTTWQVIAFLVIVTASVFPHVVMVRGIPRFGGPMSWWTLMDNLQRMTFLPHLLMGQAMLSFLLYMGSDGQVLRNQRNWIALGVVAFLLGMFFPPGLVFVGVSYGILAILSFGARRLMSRSYAIRSWFTGEIMPRTIIGVISVPSMLYFSLMFGLYPWKRLVELDIIHPLPFSFPEYIQALGPTLPLGGIGLLLVFLLRDKKFLPIASWVIAWVLCLFVFQYVPQQSPLRFSEMTPQVPLGILATYVFYQLSMFSLKKRFRLLKHVSRFVSFIGPISIITIGLGTMASSFLWQKDFIDQKIAAGWPSIIMNNYIVYPVQGFIDGMQYIEQHTPKESIILSLMTAGNYIPAYTGRIVYIGHNNTVNLEMKQQIARQFYDGTLEQPSVWVKKQGIKYVFYGPEEKEFSKGKDLASVYPFLHTLYTNQDVTIYKVEQ